MQQPIFPMTMSTLTSPDLTDDLREKALSRTHDTLKKLDEIRRKIEMPADQLPLVVEIYTHNAGALLIEKQREEMAARTKRLPLPIRSEDTERQPMKIPPGKFAQVVSRPQWIAFRIEDISIHGDRTRWIVDDIRIGNRSQLQRSGEIPGAEFGPGGVCATLRLETCQTAMDFVLVVRYVGPEPDGEVFEATAVGIAFENERV